MLVCERNKCVGCGACVTVCSKNAIKIIDSINVLNAEIDDSKCMNCNLCKKVCEVENGVSLSPVYSWKQGWAKDSAIRENSASGGVATAIIKAFIANGGIVFACRYSEDEQLFIIDTVNENELKYKVPGSKYVKSIAYMAYPKVEKALFNKKNVLFIGLPCQVYALKKVIPSKFQKKLFTIDLICHGTPSQLLFKKFCKEHVEISIRDVKFRTKKKSKINSLYKPISPWGVADSYLISFVKAINYFESCYECKFAGTQRGSDLTLGDSWGSELPSDEIEKGISLLLIQTQKGEELINFAELHLEEVNIEKAIQHNAQLNTPEKMPMQREVFFRAIFSNQKYDWAVFKCFPILMIKQNIKKFLGHMKLYHFKGDAKYKILIKK